MSNLMAVSDSTFESEVLKAELPVLVDFWADWCPPCRALAPVVEELAQEYDGRVKIVQVNVDQNSALTSRYEVQGIPTLILFKGGEEITRTSGYKPKSKLSKEFLDPHL